MFSMPLARKLFLRRLLTGLTCLFAAWVVIVLASGGLNFHILGVGITARDFWRPMIMAAVALLLRLSLGGWSEITADVAFLAKGLWSRATVTRARVAAALAVITFVVGFAYGSAAASVVDSYAYVSQAELWLHGDLFVHQPESSAAPWPDPQWTFAPPGYRPSVNHQSIVSTYAPGFPLLLALFKLVGGQCAMALVVPLCGGLLVAMTFLVGRKVASDAVGVGAAWLMATSPAMLFVLVSPMSDVPAATFWTLATYGCLAGSVAWASGAGVAAAIAILIRPNLVYLAALMGAWLMWRDFKSGGLSRAIVRALCFGTPIVAAGLFIAGLNFKLYGSPTMSGYGDLGALFSWANISTNLQRYLTWLGQSHTPIVVIGFGSLLLPVAWLTRERGALPGRTLLRLVAFGTLCGYLPYIIFHLWWYLRFLLPCFPAIFISTVWLLTSFRRESLRQLGWAAVVVIGLFGLIFAREHAIQGFGQGQERTVSIADVVRDSTEPNSVIISALYAGNVRYYAGRMTLRYDFLDEAWLDRAVAWLDAQHMHPYLLLSATERIAFVSRFGGLNKLGRIPMEPVLTFTNADGMSLYDFRQTTPSTVVVPEPPSRWGVCPMPALPPRLRF